MNNIRIIIANLFIYLPYSITDFIYQKLLKHIQKKYISRNIEVWGRNSISLKYLVMGLSDLDLSLLFSQKEDISKKLLLSIHRPGPIQGGAVHPFVKRKAGKEPVQYPHPLLESCLERTLGVPIFQEQLMQIAMTVGGCTGEDADLLRRAMGSKRGLERIESLRETLYAGMASHGLDKATSDRIYAMVLYIPALILWLNIDRLATIKIYW